MTISQTDQASTSSWWL